MASFASRTRPSFGDSSYYPAGWDRERLLSASTADLRGLPANEFNRMRAGMIERMGIEEFQRWVSLLSSSASSEDNTLRQQDEAGSAGMRAHPTVKSPSLAVPDFVRAVQERYATGPWGFVIFDTVGHEMSDDTRQKQRERVEAQIRAPFEKYCDVDGVKDVAEHFHLEWVQERAAGSDAELVARYKHTSSVSRQVNNVVVHHC